MSDKYSLPCGQAFFLEDRRNIIMNEREAIVPPGMEAVYEKIHYAPAVR